MAAGDKQQDKQLAEVTDSTVRDGWGLQAGEEGAGETWLTGKWRGVVGTSLQRQVCHEKSQACFCSEEDWEGWGGCLPRPTGKHPGWMDQASWYHHVSAHSRPDSIGSNICFATTRNGQLNSNHFLQHTFFYARI